MHFLASSNVYFLGHYRPPIACFSDDDEFQSGYARLHCCAKSGWLQDSQDPPLPTLVSLSAIHAAPPPARSRSLSVDSDLSTKEELSWPAPSPTFIKSEPETESEFEASPSPSHLKLCKPFVPPRQSSLLSQDCAFLPSEARSTSLSPTPSLPESPSSCASSSCSPLASIESSPLPSPPQTPPARKHSSSRPFACPHCSSTFLRRFNLSVHLNTHNPDREKKYTCVLPGCSSSFFRMPDLRRHLRTVSHRKPGQRCAEKSAKKTKTKSKSKSKKTSKKTSKK
ncbi:hypothetical protein HDU87_003759 [Geranomyces variabilis]|uniref:C2H2-type domain-containing protein n=1 Tax=Geranomyces variabilis TaxID=109894 RepID=A0AAD5XMC3_9FUNG|nr:hypothetical protein HDU87_003759 [Geranomyces variabilis]